MTCNPSKYNVAHWEENRKSSSVRIPPRGRKKRLLQIRETIHLVGMNFISAEKQVDGWKEEVVDKTKEPSYLG